MNESAQSDSRPKRENPLLSILLNIVIPVIILMRFSSDEWLGPMYGLLVALAFPLAYGIFDYSQRRTLNFLPIVGIVGILLTGGIGLLKLDPRWIAVKEGAVPLVIGIAVLGSLKTRFSLLSILLNQVIDSAAVNAALDARRTRPAYEKRLVNATIIVAGSFFLSALLNYVLARLVVVSQPGTVAFNEELGKMTALSFPVISVPAIIILTIAIIYTVVGIRNVTGMELEQIFRQR
ncbi:MAG: MFS transporter [Chloroflexota bacterium]|nr:MFS transporter [Chloroflexota bacterium]